MIQIGDKLPFNNHKIPHSQTLLYFAEIHRPRYLSQTQHTLSLHSMGLRKRSIIFSSN